MLYTVCYMLYYMNPESGEGTNRDQRKVPKQISN